MEKLNHSIVGQIRICDKSKFLFFLFDFLVEFSSFHISPFLILTCYFVFLFTQLQKCQSYALSQYTRIKGCNCISFMTNKVKEMDSGIKWPLLLEILAWLNITFWVKMNNKIKIGRMNVRGLMDQTKRQDVFNWLKEKNTPSLAPQSSLKKYTFC